MEYEFTVSDEGLVEVALADDLPYISHALEDSLGTRPPRGAPQDGPSTYWIDTTLAQLKGRLADSGVAPIASGNITYLIVRDGSVQARLDIDSDDDNNYDAVPVADFLELLNAWRARVMLESPAADKRMPPPRAARAMPPPG
jgi:hypothetical protein